jgi:hypothetical protein
LIPGAILSAIPRRCSPLRLAVVACAAIAAVVIGCTKQSGNKQQSGRTQTTHGQLSVKLLDSVTEMLNRLDYADPARGLQQIVERLNQWGGSQEAPAWQPDPLALEAKSAWPAVPGSERLDSLQFDLADARALRESLWLKQIAARVGKDTDLKVSAQLFDWTVRNIQLVAEDTPEAAVEHLPDEILLLGRGSAVDRAWVFILLVRQVGLDAAMLAFTGENGRQIPWLSAVWIEGRWYLFDTRLGLPIPGPNGEGVATLDQLQADDTLLRQLDLEDDDGAYPVTASQLNEVTAWLEASPSSLSRRMQLVESKLPGNQKLVLSVRPSHLIEEISAAKSPVKVSLWPMPFERQLRRAKLTIPEQQSLLREMAHIELLSVATPVGPAKRRRPEDDEEQREERQVETVFPLRTGRPLHLRGEFDGPEGAKRFYMLARPSAREMATVNNQDARIFINRAKQDATYWLGLIAVEQGKEHTVLVDLFLHKTLEAFPDGRWASGARYNLARSYEESGELEKAIELYEADDSPQRHGNLLRAKRLKEKAAAADEPAATE